MTLSIYICGGQLRKVRNNTISKLINIVNCLFRRCAFNTCYNFWWSNLKSRNRWIFIILCYKRGSQNNLYITHILYYMVQVCKFLLSTISSCNIRHYFIRIDMFLRTSYFYKYYYMHRNRLLRERYVYITYYRICCLVKKVPTSANKYWRIAMKERLAFRNFFAFLFFYPRDIPG